MTAQAFRTIREAIHHTATSCGVPMKALASELDYSPSDLSMRTTLADDGRPFPADDRLIRLQELTADTSILITMADRLGFEVRPKQDRLPEILQHIAVEQKRLNDAVQLVLSTPWIPGGKRR